MKRPHDIFLPVAMVLLVVSFFTGNRNVSILINDAFFVFDLRYLLLGLTAYCLFFFFLHRMFYRRFYARIVSWMHIIVTLAVPLGMVALSLYEAENGFIDIETSRYILVYGFLALCTVQVLLFLNLVMGMAKRNA